MHRYSTEVFIPADRYVHLQLPDDWPKGRAVVTVTFEAETTDPSAPGSPPSRVTDGYDRLDVEWWEEFDDAPNA